MRRPVKLSVLVIMASMITTGAAMGQNVDTRHDRRRTKHSDAFLGGARPGKAFSFLECSKTKRGALLPVSQSLCIREPKSLHKGMQVLHPVNGTRGPLSGSIAMGSNHDNSSQTLSKIWLILAIRLEVALGMQKFS